MMGAPGAPTDRRRPDSQFQGLVEHSLVGMAIAQDDRFLYVNPKYCEIFGYSRDELLHRIKVADLAAEADRPLVEENMRTRLRGAASAVENTFKGRRKDGAVIDVEMRGAVMVIDGRPALISSLIDVTDRKRMEEMLRESERQIGRERDTAQAYLDIAGVMILVLDASGSVALINRMGCSALGYDNSAEIVGKSWIDNFVPERLRDVMREAFARLYSGNDPSIEYYENPVLTKSGEERIVAWHNTRIRDDKGSVIATLSSGEDVTEKRRADETLRAAEEKFRTIFNSVSDGIFVADGKLGRFIDVNEAGCAMFGYGREELIGSDIGTLSSGIPPYTLQDALSWHEKAEAGLAQTFEWHCKAKDGRLFWAEVSLRSLPFGGQFVGLASLRDITARKEAEHRLRRTTNALKTLSRCNSVLVHAVSEEVLFREMCGVIVEVGGYRMAWIGLAENDAEKTVRPVAHAGHEAGYLALRTFSWVDNDRGRGPTGTAIRTGAVQINRDFATNPRVVTWRGEALKRGYASNIALPLRQSDRTFGALTIYAPEPDAFDGEEVKLLTELADDIGYGVIALRTRIDREEGIRRLGRAVEETVQVIASTVEMRDSYTSGHQRRVAKIAEAIAIEMGLPDETSHGLRLAGIVHDVGKLGVPAEILSKPSRLSATEYELVKGHVQTGYDILKQVEFPWPIADIVLQHHERLDGSGYPNGLKGDAILIEARILAVADVVESMISHRPYRPARGLDAALAEIQQGKGRLYDPLVVEACIKVMSERPVVE